VWPSWSAKLVWEGGRAVRPPSNDSSRIILCLEYVKVTGILFNSDHEGLKKLRITKSATVRPRRCPVSKSDRKWTPAKILLSVASCAAAEKLSNERVVPGITSEVTI
jgi:hypothetical protein